MTTLTRTGYLVDTGPIQEIKKELTVRPIVNGDLDFLHRLSKFSNQLRMESAFPDSMELLNLENLNMTSDQNQLKLIPDLQDNSGMPHTKMKHSEQLLKQGMASFLYHVAMAKRRYPWP